MAPVSRLVSSTYSLMQSSVQRGLGSTLYRAFSTFRAASCQSFKGPVIGVVDVERQPLQEKEVRVSVQAAGLNFADYLMCKGQYQVRLQPPFVPGFEVAGQVLEVGSGVTSVTAGDHVAGLLTNGAFAEECTATENDLFKLPKNIDFPVAASLLVSYGTAHIGLIDQGAIKEGDSVLVTAAGGGVGLAAVELARKLGASQVIAAAGSDAKLDRARQHGATDTLNYNDDDVVVKHAIKSMTGGKGVDIVFDAVGGDLAMNSLSGLKWGGRFVIVGFASGDIPRFPAEKLLVNNSSATGLFWGSYRQHKPDVLRASAEQLVQWTSEGAIHPTVYEQTFGLHDIKGAFDAITSRASYGKVVICPQQE